jgi:hypothetical protein
VVLVAVVSTLPLNEPVPVAATQRDALRPQAKVAQS